MKPRTPTRSNTMPKSRAYSWAGVRSRVTRSLSGSRRGVRREANARREAKEDHARGWRGERDASPVRQLLHKP